ncbi:MAG: aldehyde dehydrogenase family protein, partial [Solirubrobacteraceae bacterium]
MSLPPFANEPILELRRASVRAGLDDAIARVDAQLPLRVPVMIDGDERFEEQLVSTDPGEPDRVVARSAHATEAEVDAAVQTARRGFAEWAGRSAEERADALVRAAAWMRERRLELAALEVRECAKPWPEADADVCEAIDFLEYYARGAIELAASPELVQVPGERNELRYVARGVAVVVAPWNFPIAIPCGMTAGALATGNTVVLKPAEQSPGCALRIVQALRAGGVPPEAISLLPGEGDVGAALVRHRDVQTSAFTGSQPVGLEIMRTAADVVPGPRHRT